MPPDRPGDSPASASPFFCTDAFDLHKTNEFVGAGLAFSLKFGRLSNMTFSFYTYAWRFTYRNNRMRVAIV